MTGDIIRTKSIDITRNIAPLKMAAIRRLAGMIHLIKAVRARDINPKKINLPETAV